jgi:hypothetical protein
MFTCAFDVEVQLDGRNLKIEHTRASAGEAKHVERIYLAAMAAARFFDCKVRFPILLVDSRKHGHSDIAHGPLGHPVIPPERISETNGKQELSPLTGKLDTKSRII